MTLYLSQIKPVQKQWHTLEILLWRGERWDPINQFNHITLLCLSQTRTWIFNVTLLSYTYIVRKYKIHLYLLRNRLEKLAIGSVLYLFLKLVQINHSEWVSDCCLKQIFQLYHGDNKLIVQWDDDDSDNVYLLYIYLLWSILIHSGEKNKFLPLFCLHTDKQILSFISDLKKHIWNSLLFIYCLD